MKKVLFAILLLMLPAVTFSQQSMDEIVKEYMGADHSYLVSDYIDKIPVYDQTEFKVIGDLTTDFKDVVVCADVEEDGEVETGYIGLLAGVKVEPGDMLEVNKNSGYRCDYGINRFGLFDVQFCRYTSGKTQDVYSIPESQTLSDHFLIMFSLSATVYIPINGCTYKDPACAAQGYNVPTSIDMSFHRFRKIVSYSVTLPNVGAYTPSTLVNATVKAYDKNGDEVDIKNTSVEQWTVSGDIATFTPVYDCVFDGVTSLAGYVKADCEPAVVNLKSGEVVTAERPVAAAQLYACGADGTLSVSGTSGQTYSVYSLSGRKVFRGTGTKLALPAGVYVVRFNGKAVKAVVK